MMEMRRSRASGVQKYDAASLRFYRAVKNGDLSECQKQLQAAGDINKRVALVNTVSTRGDSMLIVAISLEYPNVVKLLLNNGADPTFKCDTPVPGSTPLSRRFTTRAISSLRRSKTSLMSFFSGALSQQS